LDEACAKTGWQVYAYCLMNNHFHLVVEMAGMSRHAVFLLESFAFQPPVV
jgi:REP element-mobilizing transposase RayT